MADLARVRPAWHWLLGELGWSLDREWPAGCSWRRDDAYVVLEQSPAAGQRVPRGTRVDLVVAAGPETVSVPNVIGTTVERAQRSLEGAGFEVTTVTAPSNQPAGTVIDQTPAPNTEVRAGASITLAVSEGPQAEPPATTPPAAPGTAPAQPPAPNQSSLAPGRGTDGGGPPGRGPDGAGPPGRAGSR